MLAARDAAQIEANAQRINAAGGKAASIACDVADYAACQRLVLETARRFGPPDALVNNAGVIEPIGAVATADPAQWARNIQINLIGAYYAIRAVLPGMLSEGMAASSTSPPVRRFARRRVGAPIAPPRPDWRC